MECLKIDVSAILPPRDGMYGLCYATETIEILKKNLPPDFKRLLLTEEGPVSLRGVEMIRELGSLVRGKEEAFPNLEKLELVFGGEAVEDDYGVNLTELVGELERVCQRNGVELTTSLKDSMAME